MHLGHGLREQRGRLQEAECLDPAQRQRDPRADPGNHGSGAHRCATGGDGGEVAAFENRQDLLGRGIRVPKADAAEVGEHRRSLHGENPVEHADRPGMLLRPCRRESPLPGRVAGQGMDAMHLLSHETILPRDIAGTGALTNEGDQTKRLARSRSSAKSTSTA